ncbi:hypothetical protein VBD025_16115 [Virgibacillus flavescens]|uniref:hypothetical protein n=1 Tax=Virgibacillus flavescens TaxID=1611422 RepID=UPI003D32A4D7
MSKKVLGGICVILLFILAVNFYTQSSDAQSMAKEVKTLEQEKDTLRKEKDNLLKDQHRQEKREIIRTARLFKMMEYTYPYGDDPSMDIRENQLDIENRFKDYATGNQIMQLSLNGKARYLDLVENTVSKITVNDISVKQTDIDTETDEVNIDYTIEIVFEPINKDLYTHIRGFFGQMRLIKTNSGWKVDGDEQQFISVNQIEALLEK